MSAYNKHFWLYVLKLEQGRYYVGITAKTPQKRFLEHKNGYMAAQWTRKYKPLKIIDSKDLGFVNITSAQQYENIVVRKYIKKYGINNVRGGDLNYSGELLNRFGYYVSRKEWDLIILVFIMIGIIIYLGISSS